MMPSISSTTPQISLVKYYKNAKDDTGSLDPDQRGYYHNKAFIEHIGNGIENGKTDFGNAIIASKPLPGSRSGRVINGESIINQCYSKDVSDDSKDVTDGRRNKEEERRVFRYKITKTTLLIVTWMINALLANITYPSVPDLQERVGANIEEFSRAMIMRSIGWIFGCIAGGIAFDRFQKTWDMQLSLGFFVESLSVAIKPWCRNLSLMGFLYWMEGASHGIYGLVGNGMMIALWGVSTPVPIHAMHFGFKIGAFLAPLLAAPFLSNTHLNGTVNETMVNHTATGQQESRIEIPFVICGALGIASSLAYLAFFLAPTPQTLKLTNKTKSSKLKDILSPSSFRKGNPKVGILMMFFIFCYYVLVVGTGHPFVSLHGPITTKYLNLTKQEASISQLISRGAAIIAFLIMMPIAKVLPMPVIILGQWFGKAIVSILAAIFALTNGVIYTVFSCLSDFFSACAWASGMAWAECYIDVTGAAIMTFNIGSGGGGALFSWTSGYLLQYYGPTAALWFSASVAITICVLLSVAQTIMSYFGPKKR